jgi:hypothetical protein
MPTYEKESKPMSGNERSENTRKYGSRNIYIA